eukprot:10562570-Prorocentrum_lima.AAC.1
MENDPLFEDARGHAFLSQAIFHSKSPYNAEPTIPAHSHTRIMEPIVDYPMLVDRGILRPGAIPYNDF